LGTRSSHHLRILDRHPVQQLLGVLPGEKFVRVTADQFRQMRPQHADGIHHGEAVTARPLRLVGGQPPARHSECRIASLLASRRRFGLSHRNSQIAAGWQFVVGDRRTLERNRIFVRLQRDVVHQADGPEQKPHVAGQLAPDAGDALMRGESRPPPTYFTSPMPISTAIGSTRSNDSRFSLRRRLDGGGGEFSGGLSSCAWSNPPHPGPNP